MALKVAIYCRLSEEDHNKLAQTDDSLSIQNQKTMLVQYAITQGWDIYNIYSDDDYAGADRNRPQFKQLLADAEGHKFDIVLCKTQSRFTRELELVEKYIHGLFPALGIRFVSIVDNADTANKGNKKSRQINGLVNEWYLEDMSDNIRSVLLSRRQSGLHIGSFALYGYTKDPNQRGHLIIDPEAADIVREVFTLFSQGYGKTAIARRLNERGVPNPTEYKRQKGLRYAQPKRQNATLWKYFAIADMLTNETYIGNLVQGKYGSVSYKSKVNKPRPKEDWIVVENTHAAIIDRPLWDSVQTMIAEKAKPFDTGTIGIFARKVRCVGCGYTMRSSKSRGRHYLQCSNRHVAKEGCEGAFIPVAQLEELVLTELRRLGDCYLDEEALEQGIQPSNGLQGRRDRTVREQERLTKQLRDATQYIRTLYVDKVKGVLQEEDFLSLMDSFQQEKEQVERAITACQSKLTQIDTQLAQGQNRKTIVQQYLDLDHLTREMVEVLIDYIAVGKREKGSKYPPVEIHWNF